MWTCIRIELCKNLNALFIRPIVDDMTQDVNRMGLEVGRLGFEAVLKCGQSDSLSPIN